MDKIFNSPKANVYGGASMLNKYIYMKREDTENKMYFIYKIDSIINDKFPIIYECNKLEGPISAKKFVPPSTVCPLAITLL